MARRSVDWNDSLAQDLKNAEFAREFLLASIEDDISIQVALAKVIRAYGVKEFSKKVGIPSSNILRAINPKSKSSQDQLDLFI